MKTLDQHRIMLKKIADFAFAHAVNSTRCKDLVENLKSGFDEDTITNFISKCHEGYKIAQNLLIEEIKYYQSIQRETKILLKEYRRQRNKQLENETKEKIKIIEQRQHSLSHIADGIAWSILGSEIHIARRLHIGEYTLKFLDSSNIEHAIKIAETINKDPNDFALISDLTSFVQIGDLLVRQGPLIEIMELKEGKVNDQIANFFYDLEDTGITPSTKKMDMNFDKKTIKQINRIIRQKERANRAINVINTDTGIDPRTGLDITIQTPKIDIEYYYDELKILQSELESKIWSYSIIDACLHIGMYRDKGIIMASIAIERILKHETENYVIIDWLTITQSLSEPIFAKPFHPNFIIDILTGSVKVILGINFDILIELFNSFGLKTRWLTIRETNKIKQGAMNTGMTIINDRGIITSLPNGQDAFIGDGTITKILFDNIKPSSIALSMLSMEPEERNN